jgi:predicted metal-binding protein
MKRFAPESVGINLLKVMESFGLALEFCKPEKTVCIGILLIE